MDWSAPLFDQATCGLSIDFDVLSIQTLHTDLVLAQATLI